LKLKKKKIPNFSQFLCCKNGEIPPGKKEKALAEDFTKQTH
jgi:hypothetical protein